MPEDLLLSKDLVVQNLPPSMEQLAWITVFTEKEAWKDITQTFLEM